MQTTRLVKLVSMAVLLIAIVLSSHYAVSGIFDNAEQRAERQSVAQYLKEKYGQDFIIKKVEYYDDYRGDWRHLIRTYVVSKDEQPIEFLVSRFVSKPDDHWETAFFLGREVNRSYLTIRLGREFEAKCKEVAERVFSRPVLVDAGMKLTNAYQDQKLGRVPAYFELVKIHPEVFQDIHTYQLVQLVFFFTIDESNKAQEAENIFAFMNELKQLCAPGTENKIAVDYYPPDFAPEAQKAIERIGLDGFATIEAGYYTSKEYTKSGRRQCYLFLSKDEIASIKQPADILRYFKNR